MSRLRLIRNVPQDSAGIAQVENAQSPRLQRRRCGYHAGIFLNDFYVLYVLPPCVPIRDHEVHHEIAGPFLNVKILQKEAESSHLERGQLFTSPEHGEAEIQVELLRQRVILGG